MPDCVDIPETSDDVFLGGALHILQPKSGYRAGIDAVLLAAAAQHGGGLIADLGAGVGVAGLSAASRLQDAHVRMIERQAGLVELALANIARNGMVNRVRAVHSDLTGKAAELRDEFPDDSFQTVLANPPFFTNGRGTSSNVALKAAAHEMPESDLELWVRFAARIAEPGGHFLIIHRAEAAGQILAAMGRRFGAIKLVPIYARAGEPAIRVLMRGIKGSRGPLEICKPLILHGAESGFLPEVSAILRHGAPLAI